MRYLLIALSLLLGPVFPAQAQIGINIELPGMNIGINMPTYPQLVRVPGYPVYYDPQASSNYFFYDGLYWVYQSDNWYASSWYNGPWDLVGPDDVPLYLLRVPVRYYRQPPAYFHGWAADAPPRWGEHWGSDWESHRSGWDQWDRRSVPAPAPLPTYQRQYSGKRYPQAPDQQVTIRARNYHYQPHEAVAQQHFQPQAAPGGAHAGTNPQAPVPQRSPAPQQHAQPSQPRQQPKPQQPRPEQPVQQAHKPSVQPAHKAPVQHAQPKPSVQQAHKPPVQQAQPKQPSPQAQRVQTAPQGNGADRPAQQDKGPENRPAQQGKGPENKPAEQGRGQEDKKEERDPGRQ